MRRDDERGRDGGAYEDGPVDALDRGETSALRDRKPRYATMFVLGRLSIATRVVYASEDGRVIATS